MAAEDHGEAEGLPLEPVEEEVGWEADGDPEDHPEEGGWSSQGPPAWFPSLAPGAACRAWLDR